MTVEGICLDAAERSEIYKSLASAFTYPQGGRGATNVSGAEYTSAFDPAVSERACSLHEVSYGDQDQSSLFEELTRFYDYFGLSRSDGSQLPDHVAVELEFMHYLTYLEQKIDPSRPQDLASLRLAQRDFVTRHLERALNGISTKLRIDVAEQYEQIVRAAVAFVSAEAEWLNETTG
jgi:DMSO reductase family type II enzyme chaperone